MKTKGQLISDLELRFTEAKPSDDLELERDQIGHWLDIASNSLLSDYISKQMARMEDINPFYIKTSTYRGAAEEGLADVFSTDERYSIDISDISILPVRGRSRDFGVIRVQNDKNKQLVEITYDDSDFYRNLCFAKATDENMQWYRENDKIYIDGVSVNNSGVFKFRVFYIAPIDTSADADTVTYPLGDDLLPMVVDIAEETGRREFNQNIIDVENDGRQ